MNKSEKMKSLIMEDIGEFVENLEFVNAPINLMRFKIEVIERNHFTEKLLSKENVD